MLEVIKENVKLATRVKQTRLIRELVAKNIPFKDVISIERNQRWGNRGKEDAELIDILMAKKLKSAIKEELAQRRTYKSSKDLMYGGTTIKLLPEGWSPTINVRVNKRSNVAKEFRKLQKSIVS